MTEISNHTEILENGLSEVMKIKSDNKDVFDNCASKLVGGYNLNKRFGIITENEMIFAIEEIRKRHSEKILSFFEVNFKEPSKKEIIQSYCDGIPCIRKVEVVSQCIAINQTYVDTVVLPTNGNSVNSDEVFLLPSVVYQDVQPGHSPNDYKLIEKICKEYQPLLQALEARGVNPHHVVVDAWCVGYSGPDCNPKERIAWPSMFICEEGKDSIPYGRPVEGIEIRISLTKQKVIRFDDIGSTILPIPYSNDGCNSQYIEIENQRKTLKPIIITQPKGVSFKVTDINTVEWENWRFQVGFTGREGIVLHGLTMNGRPILHRMSFAEMVR